jgi:hypothetical protein
MGNGTNAGGLEKSPIIFPTFFAGSFFTQKKCFLEKTCLNRRKRFPIRAGFVMMLAVG